MATGLSFDPRYSRAVLIGAAQYPKDPQHFHALPGVRNNVEELTKLLRDADVIGMPSECITSWTKQSASDRYTEIILPACDKARDLILIYYAGHGLPHKDKRRELLLMTPRSTSEKAEQTSYPYTALRDAVQASKA